MTNKQFYFGQNVDQQDIENAIKSFGTYIIKEHKDNIQGLTFDSFIRGSINIIYFEWLDKEYEPTDTTLEQDVS